MSLLISRRLIASACAVAAFAVVPSVQVAHASAAPLGTVLVSGSAWAGSAASMGNLNVYSNGATFTGRFQCTDIVMRWATVRYSESTYWPASSAADMWNVGPRMPVPFEQLPNGGSQPPQFGDIIVYNVTTQFPYGHVAVVSGTGPGYVNVVEENGSWTGRATLPIYGTTMPPRAGSNQPVIGWLRGLGAPYVSKPRMPGGQILDSWGGIHPFGSATLTSSHSYWSGWNIARDVATVPGNPNSGYTLDGWGGVHPFGTAPAIQTTGYWRGWDIARKLVLRADGHSGYVLDGWGGLHPFGTAGDMPPMVRTTGYWHGWDIANAVVLRSDGVSGYVLDGFGGLHPFGPASESVPNVALSPYWKGWDIARDIVLSSDNGGYILDGFGGVHAFGTAAPLSTPSYYNHDLARGLVLTDAGGGYVVFQTGVVRPFGDAVAINLSLMGIPLGQAVS
jgi:CHAP domain